MVCKQIKVYVKPGHLAEYLAAQAVWNRETAGCSGFVRAFCGQDAAEPNVVHLHFYWQTRADLDRFMADDHDRIAALAGADAHIERIEVSILDQRPLP